MAQNKIGRFYTITEVYVAISHMQESISWSKDDCFFSFTTVSYIYVGYISLSVIEKEFSK